MLSLARLLAVVALAMIASSAAAQAPATPPEGTDLEAALAKVAAEGAVVGAPANLTYANRFIVQLRSSVLGRVSEERVAAARITLDRLAEAGTIGPVQARQVGAAASLDVAGRRIVAILPSDVDTLSGETPATVAAAAAQRLEVALTEVSELRRPRRLLVAGLEVLLGTLFYAALGWLLVKAHAAARRRIGGVAERGLRATVGGYDDIVQSSRILEYLNRFVSFLTWVFGLFFVYAWVTFSLRRFPYTRPWGESLRAFLLGQLSRVGAAILDALPGLFMVLVIALLTRFIGRVLHLLFQAIEDGRVAIPWIYPETAQPTRRLTTVGLWLFGLVMAYPYLPGSGSEAFKGMSVFIGLVISLGSSGIVNQVMSGFTLTYSRALRVGDFVGVGDMEGTVTQVGTLSTKVKTPNGADVTIPNAVMVSQTVTNYSRFADTEGVFVTTQVTIGYDVPWRQVEALLLLAASRSAGIRSDPAPRVAEAALEDFYIRYTLLVALERPAERRRVLAIVHRNVLDAFNEYGVQITSPNYEADPGAKKIVPRDQWFAAPAAEVKT